MHIKFCFRVDASLQAGTGHVMRCLSLADALKEKGAASQFISREHEGNLIEAIRNKGYRVHALPLVEYPKISDSTDQPPLLAHAAWLGTTQVQDATECAEILVEQRPDWLIVDHYSLDASWERTLKPYCRRLMVIDDLVDRQHNCDLLLNQNLGFAESDYKTLVSAGCKLLLGPHFALLRPEFAQLRNNNIERRAQHTAIRRVLITMGGVDRNNATRAVLESLLTELSDEILVTIVLGSSCPWIADIEQLLPTLPFFTELCTNASNMAQLMADADVAIGAAGSTSWERCCLGLPSLMAILAENQETIAQELDRHGAAISIGYPSRLEFKDKLRKSIRQLTDDTAALKKIASCAATLVDGEGVSRIINHLTAQICQ